MLRRNILLLILGAWGWIVGSALYVLIPVPETNAYAQTISRLTWTSQVPVAGHEAVRFTVAHEIAAGRGFSVPEGLRNAPDVAKVGSSDTGELPTLEPRFSPLYGVLLGGLAKLSALRTNGGTVDYLVAPLTTYRVLTIVPALIAAALLIWTFGQSVALRGLKDVRFWYVMIPAIFLSPLTLRMTYLTEHALAAALCWSGCYLLNNALFKAAKEQKHAADAIGAGVLLMFGGGLVPIACAPILGLGGVLLTSKDAQLARIGRSMALGVGVVALLILIPLNMWAFDKLLPLLAYYEPMMQASVRDVFSDLVTRNGLLWMCPPALLGILVLVTRILRTQELEEQHKVDLFRAGQGAFHWGTYWTLLAAVAIAIVDGAFFYGTPQVSRLTGLGVEVPWEGALIPITFFPFHFGGDGWVVLLPLMLYYGTFVFREPVLMGWRPWWHNSVRVAALVWFVGCAQPQGGIILPVLEAIYRWSGNVANYYPMGRIQ